MKHVDPTDLTANQRLADERDEQDRQEQRQRAEDLKWVMSDTRGRRFIHDVLETTGVYRNPFTGNSETFFRCGEMNVGQRLLAQLMATCPKRYLEMIKEQENDRPSD